MAKENSMIQMYTSTSTGSVSIDVPDDGFLLACMIGITRGAAADNNNSAVSLEFGSVNSQNSHDTRAMLAYLEWRSQLTTSGMIQAYVSERFTYGDPGIRVFGGERLYLHTVEGAGTFVDARCLLLFNFATFVARRR